MRPTARSAVALALFLISFPFAPRAHAARAYVVESDFSSGSYSTVNATTRALSCNAASVYSDARVRWYNGQVFIVNTREDFHANMADFHADLQFRCFNNLAIGLGYTCLLYTSPSPRDS